jgi:hypothetical protein
LEDKDSTSTVQEWNGQYPTKLGVRLDRKGVRENGKNSEDRAKSQHSQFHMDEVQEKGRVQGCHETAGHAQCRDRCILAKSQSSSLSLGRLELLQVEGVRLIHLIQIIGVKQWSRETQRRGNRTRAG